MYVILIFSTFTTVPTISCALQKRKFSIASGARRSVVAISTNVWTCLRFQPQISGGSYFPCHSCFCKYIFLFEGIKAVRRTSISTSFTTVVTFTNCIYNAKQSELSASLAFFWRETHLSFKLQERMEINILLLLIFERNAF